ncbi:Zn-dependent hydrolase [Sporosarcina sp. 179-K 8C2 HS]|uniref:Zn-dependent hydrolase n=1 Tax=Sporosarcina sp. 179-K 8C2 HS TaxID=3142387 RepID=UPI0039A12B4F
MNLKRLQKSIDVMAQFTKGGQGINRLAYTKVEQNARNYIIKQLKEEGMTVRVDAVGNVIARRDGFVRGLPAVAMGSHIDSVYDAGKYDGVAGVIAALEVIRSLNEQNIQTLHPIEILVFACEESSRFGVSTLGSKAVAGLLKIEEVSSLEDCNGVSIAQAFEENGLDVHRVKEAVLHPDHYKSFIELHVEQGPILEKEQLDVGIVAAIAGPTRYRIIVKGQASHSGTTPMNYRKDALLGAAEIALEIERAASSESSKGTVGTVGVLNIKPGGMNIVPGEAYMDIDIRGIDVTSKKVVIDALKAVINRVTQTRGLQISSQLLTSEQPVHMDSATISDLEVICKEQNIRYKVMPSGAGHDAMNMAVLCPSGMIFVPSQDGLSHNPNEFTSAEQIGKGTVILQEYILKSAIAASVERNQPNRIYSS